MKIPVTEEFDHTKPPVGVFDSRTGVIAFNTPQDLTYRAIAVSYIIDPNSVCLTEDPTKVVVNHVGIMEFALIDSADINPPAIRKTEMELPMASDQAQACDQRPPVDAAMSQLRSEMDRARMVQGDLRSRLSPLIPPLDAVPCGINQTAPTPVQAPLVGEIYEMADALAQITSRYLDLMQELTI